MESMAKSDIFFLVTTIAVIAVTAAILTVLIYAIRIVRDIKSVSRKISRGGDAVVEDLSAVREGIKRGVRSAVSMFAGKMPKKRTKRARKKAPEILQNNHNDI